MHEIRQPRFGKLAVDLGFVHPDHLQQALAVQKALAERLAASIEVILVELRYMTLTEATQVGRACRDSEGT